MSHVVVPIDLPSDAIAADLIRWLDSIDASLRHTKQGRYGFVFYPRPHRPERPTAAELLAESPISEERHGNHERLRVPHRRNQFPVGAA